MQNLLPTRGTRVLSWTCQILAAAILAQTLFFKFTGAEESKYIFETLGMEPWGRIGSGALELVAVALLLVPPLAVYGALLALGTIAGAIAAHVFFLGIEVQGDGGLLFTLALVVFAAAGIVLFLRRGELPLIGPRLVAHSQA